MARRWRASFKGSDGRWHPILQNGHRWINREKLRSVRAWGRKTGHQIRARRINPYPHLILDSDTRMPRAKVAAALERTARDLDRQLFIREGWRTNKRQWELWNAYVARGKAAPAVAYPGTSRHETGHAADVGVVTKATGRPGIDLGSYSGGRSAALRHGLRFAVPGESWHVEK